MRLRRVGDVIVGQIALTLAPEATVQEAARRMRIAQVGSVMVVAADRLVGIFTERDGLFRVLAEGTNPNEVKLSQVMTTGVTTVRVDSLFVDALELMYEGGFRHVPVLDGDVPVGIVSIRDAMGQELEGFRFALQRQQEALPDDATPSGDQADDTA